MPKIQVRFDRAKKDYRIRASIGAIGFGGAVSAGASMYGGYLATLAAVTAPTAGTAIGGATVAATGAATAGAAAGTAAFVISTAGVGLLALGLAGFAYSSYRVFKPRDRESEMNLKHARDEARYQYWDCYFSHIGFLGSKAVGKTTLLKKFNNVANPDNGSTTEQYYLIVKLSSDDSQEKVFGFIGDGQGEDRGDRGHQVNIASMSEIYVFVVDHRNIRDVSKENIIEFNTIKGHLDEIRMKEHENFIHDTIKTRKPMHVLVLFNMHDIWGDGPDKDKILNRMKDLQNKINTLYYDKKPQVEIWPFCAMRNDDILRLRRFLKDRTILVTTAKEESEKNRRSNDD